MGVEKSEERKTVIITGASRGIGHAAASLFLERDWRIITCSRNETPPECKRDPNWTHHIPTDLADPYGIANFIEKALEALDGQPLHALVNNAGVSPKTPFKERLGCLNGDLDAWREVFELNFFAGLKLARGFASPLHKGKGAIVNITSILGNITKEYRASYSSSKFGLDGMTVALASELSEMGILANSVGPGFIDTDLTRSVLGEKGVAEVLRQIPIKRLGQANEIASLVS